MSGAPATTAGGGRDDGVLLVNVYNFFNFGEVAALTALHLSPGLQCLSTNLLLLRAKNR